MQFVNLMVVKIAVILAEKQSCFPSTSKVNLDSGESVTMSELQLGDRVKIGLKKLILMLHFCLFV